MTGDLLSLDTIERSVITTSTRESVHRLQREVEAIAAGVNRSDDDAPALVLQTPAAAAFRAVPGNGEDTADVGERWKVSEGRVSTRESVLAVGACDTVHRPLTVVVCRVIGEVVCECSAGEEQYGKQRESELHGD